MRLTTAVLAATLAASTQTASCSCGGTNIKRSYPEPTVDELVAHVRGIEERASSFRCGANMDYWLNGQRVKGDVLMMGEWGSHFRFNALNPTGGNVAADLACDGETYQYIDYNKNCQLTGLCSRDAVARLLRVSLEPDDFVELALGSTPVIQYASGKVTWQPDGGQEILELQGTDGYRQRIVLDGRDKRWDVLTSDIYDADGKPVWQLENKDFHAVKTPSGEELRLPGKTRFEQPPEKADLIVRWKEQEASVPLPAAAFTMNIPAGLPQCGGGAPAP